MLMHEITEQAGAYPRRKRVGRGESSGMGRTSGRGNKGCQARAGGGTRPLHEGGQMPLFRRLPKRGFSNFNFRREYEVVNLSSLDANFGAGETVSAATLREKGLVRGGPVLVKILGDGSLTKKLSLEVHATSASAKAALEKAGCTVKIIALPDPAANAKAKRNSKKKQRTAKPAAKA